MPEGIWHGNTQRRPREGTNCPPKYWAGQDILHLVDLLVVVINAGGLKFKDLFCILVSWLLRFLYIFLCSVRSKDPLLIIRFRQGQKKRWKRKITNLNDWRASIVGCNEQERGDTSPFVWEYTWCVPMPMPIVWVLWGHEIVCDRVRAVSSAQYENVRIYDGCANCCGLCTVQLKVWCSAVQLRAQSMMETRAFVCGQTVLPP